MEMSGKDGKSEYHVTTAVADITVVLGRAQLLKRKIQRGLEVSSEMIVSELTSIEEAGWRLSGYMREVEDDAVAMKAQIADMRDYMTAMHQMVADTDQHFTRVRTFLNERRWDQAHAF
jgi:hypothetical protein